MDIRSLVVYKIRQIEETYNVKLNTLKNIDIENNLYGEFHNTFASPKLSELFADMTYDLLVEAYNDGNYRLSIETETVLEGGIEDKPIDVKHYTINYINDDSCTENVGIGFYYKDPTAFSIEVCDGTNINYHTHEHVYMFNDLGFCKRLYDKILANIDLYTWLTLQGFNAEED